MSFYWLRRSLFVNAHSLKGDYFSTAGGEIVVITALGTNIGVKGSDASRNKISVTFGRGGSGDPKFVCTNCAVTNLATDNTELRCTAPPGYGAGHTWNVSEA